MNTQTLLVVLSSESSDNSKVRMLGNIVNTITDFNWDMLPNILVNVSNDNCKKDIVAILKESTITKDKHVTSETLSKIFSNMRNDNNKTEIFNLLSNVMATINGDDLRNILSKISNNNNVTSIVKIWSSNNDGVMTCRSLGLIVQNMQNNNNKVEVISHCVSHICNGTNDCLEFIISTISNDNNKNEALALLAPKISKLRLTPNVCAIIKLYTNNNNKIEAMNIMKSVGLIKNLTCSGALELIDSVTSTYKNSMINIIGDTCNYDHITSEIMSNLLCEKLIELCNCDKKQFVQYCNTFRLSEIMYKPFEDRIKERAVITGDINITQTMSDLYNMDDSIQIISVGNVTTQIIKRNGITTTITTCN